MCHGSHPIGRIVRHACLRLVVLVATVLYFDAVMKLFNAFGIGVVIAAAALALIYRREVREMVLPIIRNLW